MKFNVSTSADGLTVTVDALDAAMAARKAPAALLMSLPLHGETTSLNVYVDGVMYAVNFSVCAWVKCLGKEQV